MWLKRFIYFLFVFGISSAAFAQADTTNTEVDVKPVVDTTAFNEDEVIDEVVQSDSAAHVKEEKVEYLSQVTKYGFKNLFRNYRYNPAEPYTQQVNPYAENYMRSYMKNHSSRLKNLGYQSKPYFQLIEGILAQYGLPPELKYLAVIESNLNASAISVAGAVGPWQFMDYTAREYGLKVNNQIDERRDYRKSTHAAAKYLLTLYKDLKDWLLVIAAYNGGPGRVYQAMKKSGSRDFWKLQYYLPEESRNHVKKFIATHYIMENEFVDGSFYAKQKEEKAAPDIPQELEESLTSTIVKGRYDAATVSEELEMDPKIFETINPQFNEVLASGSEFDMKIPKDKLDLFTEKKYEILNKSVEAILNNATMSSKTVYGKKKLIF